MGETLTPRQFEVLYNARIEDGGKVKYIKDNDSNLFLDARDIVRLLDEQRESARRRMVIEGKCSENESEEKLQEMVQQACKDAPTEFDEKRMRREFRSIKDLFEMTQNPQKLFEKEYHFDEGLGQSLKDHVDELKATFPDL